jgi:formylglycine-generating enzyme required for sulfatase activity
MNAINPTQLKAKRLLRLDRGGGWDYGARDSRASNRGLDPIDRYGDLGFRLVRNK